jgi:hypothetical protein
MIRRRNELADWLYRERDGAPYTTLQIVEMSGIYDDCINGRYDTARRDLMRLEKNGVVRRANSLRPARWEFGQ